MFPVTLVIVPSVKAVGNDQSSNLWWKLCQVWPNPAEPTKTTSIQWGKARWHPVMNYYQSIWYLCTDNSKVSDVWLGKKR